MSSGRNINAWLHWEEADLTNTVHKQLVPSQAFLELGAHETITSARVGKNGEMDPEKRKVDEEWYQDQSNCTGSKVAPKVFLERNEIMMVGVSVKIKLTMDGFFRMSKRSHKSTRTAIPIATTASIPFTLEPQAHAIKTPVAINQPHHSGVNGLHGGEQSFEWWQKNSNLQISQLAEAHVGIHGER